MEESCFSFEASLQTALIELLNSMFQMRASHYTQDFDSSVDKIWA